MKVFNRTTYSNYEYKKRNITIKQTLGAKVLGQEKKSSDRQLRTSRKYKLKKLKYIDERDVGLEAAIF